MPRIGVGRHGATAWSLAGRYQGRADPPLCAQGEVEAACLGKQAARQGVDRVVSSPLRRARQTAASVAAYGSLSVPGVDDGLLEVDFGLWEGKTQAEIRAIWPAQLRDWKSAPERFTFPGGESLADAQRRVAACLACWRADEAGGAILLVTHLTWIRLAVLSLSGRPLACFRELQVATGSLLWLDGPAPLDIAAPISQREA